MGRLASPSCNLEQVFHLMRMLHLAAYLASWVLEKRQFHSPNVGGYAENVCVWR